MQGEMCRTLLIFNRIFRIGPSDSEDAPWSLSGRSIRTRERIILRNIRVCSCADQREQLRGKLLLSYRKAGTGRMAQNGSLVKNVLLLLCDKCDKSPVLLLLETLQNLLLPGHDKQAVPLLVHGPDKVLLLLLEDLERPVAPFHELGIEQIFARAEPFLLPSPEILPVGAAAFREAADRVFLDTEGRNPISKPHLSELFKVYLPCEEGFEFEGKFHGKSMNTIEKCKLQKLN
jgi:hypothetical protein